MDQAIGWLPICYLQGVPMEVCGYIASALVLATFSMRSMRRLRYAAIGSNVAFILYAGSAGLHPILALHCVLLPMNIFRLAQIEKWQMAGRRIQGMVPRE
jgi:hypothetical protein